MTKSYSYKGRFIDIRISAELEGCAASFSIAENVGNETHDTPFYFTQRFASETIALDASRRAAANKIDTGYATFFA